MTPIDEWWNPAGATRRDFSMVPLSVPQ